MPGGAAPCAGVPYALVGCTVAPGFEFRGFELGGRDELEARFPLALQLIRRLT